MAYYGLPIVNKEKHTDLSKRYASSVVDGGMRSREGDKATLSVYMPKMVEKALQKNEYYIKYFPVFKHYYNIDQKRMKNIAELAEDYSTNYEIEARDTFMPFVYYQITKNDLDNINLKEYTKTQQLDIIVMLTRLISDVTIKINKFYHESSKDKREFLTSLDNNKNFLELVSVLSKSLVFLRNNVDIIRDVENFDGSKRATKEEQAHFDVQIVAESNNSNNFSATAESDRENFERVRSYVDGVRYCFYLTERYLDSTTDSLKLFDVYESSILGTALKKVRESARQDIKGKYV
jgi:hypothetical protein